MKNKILIFFVSSLFIVNLGIAEAATSGGKYTTMIDVLTKADWSRTGSESITLSNTPLRVKYLNFFGKENSKTIYPKFNIKIRNANGKEKFSRILSSKSVKITLKKNQHYYIDVSYDGNGTWLKYAKLKKARLEGNPYWYVSATNKIAWCR